MMNFKNYYEQNETYIEHLDNRLKKIIRIVSLLKPKKILDVGCGQGFLIEELQKRVKANFSGIDVYAQKTKRSWSYKRADITEGLPFDDKTFDLVILGEVIEHVPNPDFLLEEILRILQPGGRLIVSTPNLVSWANRILVPLGVQPLFTETSSEINLGRYLKILGQGSKVQGHLKIFTQRSLTEILKKSGFAEVKKSGARFFFPFPLSLVDSFFSRFPSFASNLLFVAKKR